MAWNECGGGIVACFEVCGAVVCGNIDITAKRKIGLCSQCLGSDCNMRHPEKEEEIWPH